MMVIGKDLETGLPIVAQITTKIYKDQGKKVYVNSFIPDIDSIVGVGLLNKRITASRTEFDGSESKVELNACEKFLDDQTELLTTYYKQQQKYIETDTEADAVAKIKKITDEKTKRGWTPDLYAKKLIDITNTFKTKDTVKSSTRTISEFEYDERKGKEKSLKDKGWSIVPGSTRWGIFRKLDNGDLIPYNDKNYHVNFNIKRDNKHWETPAGLRIIDKIRRGTILHIRDSSKYSGDLVSGIVLFKDDMSLTMLKVANDYKGSVEDLTYDDVVYYKLFYKTMNIGTEDSKYA